MTSGWDDRRTAELYDRFARTHALYRETSRDLVGAAALDNASVVVDLACGTGVTTEAVLEQVGSSATVVALDASDAMLQIARRHVTDPRVKWVHAPALELPQYASDVDAIICNSAIWQLDMAASISAAEKVLRSGGLLVFNIGQQFLILPLTEAELRPAKPSFFDLIQAIAVLEHDFVPPHPALHRSRPLKPGGVVDMIRQAGLVPEEPVTFEYDNPPEALLAWLNVPVFGQNVLPGMPYETQVAVLDKAYERLDKSPGPKNVWMAFVGRKP